MYLIVTCLECTRSEIWTAQGKTQRRLVPSGNFFVAAWIRLNLTGHSMNFRKGRESPLYLMGWRESCSRDQSTQLLLISLLMLGPQTSRTTAWSKGCSGYWRKEAIICPKSASWNRRLILPGRHSQSPRSKDSDTYHTLQIRESQAVMVQYSRSLLFDNPKSQHTQVDSLVWNMRFSTFCLVHSYPRNHYRSSYAFHLI